METWSEKWELWIPAAVVVAATVIYTFVRCCQLWRRRRDVIEHKRFLTAEYISQGRRIPVLMLRFYRQDMKRYLALRDGRPQRWFIRRKPFRKYLDGG